MLELSQRTLFCKPDALYSCMEKEQDCLPVYSFGISYVDKENFKAESCSRHGLCMAGKSSTESNWTRPDAILAFIFVLHTLEH